MVNGGDDDDVLEVDAVDVVAIATVEDVVVD